MKRVEREREGSGERKGAEIVRRKQKERREWREWRQSGERVDKEEITRERKWRGDSSGAGEEWSELKE